MLKRWWRLLFGCRHDWFKHPVGSPRIAREDTPLAECRKCGEIAWMSSEVSGE